MMYVLCDVERISLLCREITETIVSQNKKQHKFSKEALKELKNSMQVLSKMYEEAMQIVSSLFNHTGRIGDGTETEAALLVGHSAEHVNILVNGEGLAQIDSDQILMDEGELVITVQQILMHSTVAHNSRRELLSTISRIAPGESQSTLTHIAGSIVNIVDLNQLGEVSQQTLGKGNILISEQAGIATVLILLGLGLCLAIQTAHCIAVFFHLLGELSHILCGLLTILLSCLTQLDYRIVGLLVNVAITEFTLQVITERNIVQITEQFPLLHHVCLSAVQTLLIKNRVFCKNGILIQEGVNHNHDDTDHDNDRN